MFLLRIFRNSDGSFFLRPENMAQEYFMKQIGFISFSLFSRSSNKICIYLSSYSWGEAPYYCVRVIFWFI